MSYLNKQTNLYFNTHLNQISELTETSKLVYSALFTQTYITSRNTELTAFTLSQRNLIDTLKISERNVRDSLKQLKEFSLISTYLSKDKINTYFKINDPVSKEEITDFHKENIFEVKDGYSYNPNIIIPAEIIQLDEIPSIRLAIGELQFAWMDSKNNNKQYYNLCNLKQAEKVLFKNFTKTLRTIRSKGYIKYDVSYFGKYSGYKNIVFNFNPKQEEKPVVLPKAPVADASKAEKKQFKQKETIKAPVADASKAENEFDYYYDDDFESVFDFDYYYDDDFESVFDFDYYYDDDFESNINEEEILKFCENLNALKEKQFKQKETIKAPVADASKAEEVKMEIYDNEIITKELETLNSERKNLVIKMNNEPNKASIYYSKIIKIDEKIAKIKKQMDN